MTLQLDAPPVVRGSQIPRIWSAPKSVSSETYDAAIRVAELARIKLDDWQKFVLEHALAEDARGNWAAPTVALVCPRQNGKNEILAIRELLGLFVLNEREIIHTAHRQPTASLQFRRVLGIIKAVPEFRDKMDRPIYGKGSEAIELNSGQRILFMTRTSGGARGSTVDCIIYDEAYELPSAEISALSPTSLAVELDQTWYASSAVDQEKHSYGVELARTRERGIRGTDGLAYFEWSIEGDDPSAVSEDRASDQRLWAQANPALGIRIPVDRMRHKREVDMGPREFAVECLGVGDWPRTDDLGGRILTPAAWAVCTDIKSQLRDPVCFAFDVSPDRSSACIAVAGDRADGLAHVEIVEHGRNTGWLAARLAGLVKDHKTYSVLCDPYGPAGSLVPEAEAAVGKLPNGKTRLMVISAKEHAQACGNLYDSVMDSRLRHLGTPELSAAVNGARTRVLGEAWAWSRKSSDCDISPLVASTLALWGNSQRPKTKARFINLNNI